MKQLLIINVATIILLNSFIFKIYFVCLKLIIMMEISGLWRLVNVSEEVEEWIEVKVTSLLDISAQ